MAFIEVNTKKKNFFQEWEFDFNPNISHLTSPFVFQEELI